jgi:hypothetical protein
MSLRKTVISHFFNEEYLMPWWIEHHKKLFDHGIMIDYNSTDESRRIIEQMAPGWQIIDSRNSEFSAIGCDQEVMEIEKSLPGWKIALNVTEFLCCEDLNELLNQAELAEQTCLQGNGIIMADPLDRQLPDPVASQSLVSQRHYGFFEKDSVLKFLGFPSRGRLLHRRPDGAYHPGRHQTHHVGVVNQPDLLILWFGFSPWNDRTISRKLGIKSRIPEADQRQGLGYHHLVDYQQLEAMRRAEASKARDLRTSPIYRRATGLDLQWTAEGRSLEAPLASQSR